MATVRTIITSALRKTGQLALAEDAEVQELSDGSDLLISLYLEWLATGTFGRLCDVIASDDTTAGENQRIAAGAGVTVTLPMTITDPCSTTPRPPRNRAAVVVANANTNSESYLFDAAIGDWVRIDQIPSNDTVAPLSSVGADGLASCLAERWAGELGQQVSPVVIRSAAEFRRTLASHFDGSSQPVRAEYF